MKYMSKNGHLIRKWYSTIYNELAPKFLSYFTHQQLLRTLLFSKIMRYKQLKMQANNFCLENSPVPSSEEGIKLAPASSEAFGEALLFAEVSSCKIDGWVS